MKHLIISRELPPAPYAAGGIGTYVDNLMRLLAAEGETVHVIGQRWEGAPLAREALYDGRLIIHRIAAGDDPAQPLTFPADERWQAELRALRHSAAPAQWFALQAALLAERLIDEQGIDVVEGQEWEAPLYFLLLRRELGLGARRRPPCLVHLHSPSEFITRFDGQHGARADKMALARLERYCIEHADAHLCPSRFLARQCEAHYGLAPDSVRVIRLPIGPLAPVARPPAVWASGSICYVGRLEPRKGIIEWVDAAVRAALTDPDVHFDFIGADQPAGDSALGMRDFLWRRIPRPLRPRFRFLGAQPRAALPALLARARAAVVPSRWENFPNTCIEAMGSGLPVIASRFGGMAEMIEDGVTGWLAEAPDQGALTPALHGALLRCLRATPAQRESMGAAAAHAVAALCDNRRTVQAHLTLRAHLAERAAPPAPAARPLKAGVVLWARGAEDTRAALAALRAQTTPPAVLMVVGAPDAQLARLAEEAGARWLAQDGMSDAAAWQAGYAAARAAHPPLDAWMFLDDADTPAPDALERLGAALAAQPKAGLVGCWTALPDAPAQVPLPPELPRLWFENDIAHVTLFRAQALPVEAHWGTGAATMHWELAVDTLARGWRGLIHPALLARRAPDPVRPGVLPWHAVTAFRERRGALMRRHRDVVARDAAELAELYVPVAVSAPCHGGARAQHGPSRGVLAQRLARLRRRAERALARLRGAPRRPAPVPARKEPAA